MSHPNRSKKNPSEARNPTPEEILHLRLAVGLSPVEAAKRVYAAVGAWEQWEVGERPMHPVFWRSFRIAASKKIVGRVTSQLMDADDPLTYMVRAVETKGFLGVIAGPHDDRWACFYTAEVGSPRPSGLGGGYEHNTFEKALAAFEQLLD
jgi:putative transcriptional regulator